MNYPKPTNFGSLMISMLFGLSACADGDNSAMVGADSGMDDGAVVSSTTVSLTQSGLPTLAGGFHYEGWAIIEAAPVSTGKFNVDASGAIVDLDGIAIAGSEFEIGRDLSDATEFVLTIEENGDIDITPNDTHILAGLPTQDGAQLTLDGGTESLGIDFTEASGTYGLATPTDNDDTNENSGVWFVDFGDAPNPSLNLPVLPAGWAYEGWVVVGGTPVSTGRFTTPTGSDDAAPHSGTDNPGPPVPGEDLLMDPPSGLNFPVNLAEQTVVVSIEPQPDDSAAPFTLKPLSAVIPPSVETHQNQVLTNNGAPDISLTISLR